MIGAACVLGLALAGSSGLAFAQDGETWTRAAAQNGAFSVETPCNASEIAALASVPDGVLIQVKLAPQSRIVCKKDKMILLAGVMEVDALPAGGSSLFDMITGMALNNKAAKGKPMVTTIGGKRALINREEADGSVAQTGFVEISPTRAVILVAGFDKPGLSVAAQGAAIDRFYASTKVTGR